MGTREDYEGLTVPKLQEELASRQLDTSGNKPELVDRLVADDELRAETDEDSGLAPEEADEQPGTVQPYGQRDQRRIVEAGGHQILVDADPPRADEIVTCSVCGAEGGCVHTDPDSGVAGWATAGVFQAPVLDPQSETGVVSAESTQAPVRLPDPEDKTFGVDETRNSGLEIDTTPTSESDEDEDED